MPWIPYDSSIRRSNVVWSTVSKAADRSKNARAARSPRSRACKMSGVRQFLSSDELCKQTVTMASTQTTSSRIAYVWRQDARVVWTRRKGSISVDTTARQMDPGLVSLKVASCTQPCKKEEQHRRRKNDCRGDSGMVRALLHTAWTAMLAVYQYIVPCFPKHLGLSCIYTYTPLCRTTKFGQVNTYGEGHVLTGGQPHHCNGRNASHGLSATAVFLGSVFEALDSLNLISSSRDASDDSMLSR